MWQSRFSNSQSRGQTTIDYTIGIVLFISVIGGVFLLLPTVFEPFSTSTTAETIMADQIATQLTTELLHAEDPGTVDAVCTAAFFSGNTSLDETCSFTADDSVTTIVGLDSTTDTSIYIHEVQEGGAAGSAATTTVDGVRYDLQRNTGETGRNTAVATRTVRLNGEIHRLSVEVW
jgi:hypothetical protein